MCLGCVSTQSERLQLISDMSCNHVSVQLKEKERSRSPSYHPRVVKRLCRPDFFPKIKQDVGGFDCLEEANCVLVVPLTSFPGRLQIYLAHHCEKGAGQNNAAIIYTQISKHTGCTIFTEGLRSCSVLSADDYSLCVVLGYALGCSTIHFSRKSSEGRAWVWAR